MFKEDEPLFRVSNCILHIKQCNDIEHLISILNWSEYVKEKTVKLSQYQSKKKLM